MDVIQDDGLIFAQGDRDSLDSDHGKTYCTYLLLKKYLNESQAFSRYSDVPDIFIEKVQKPQAEPSPATESDLPVNSDPEAKVEGYLRFEPIETI